MYSFNSSLLCTSDPGPISLPEYFVKEFWDKIFLATEIDSLVFRRSLYIALDMKKGDILNESNLRIVRPGLGLPPKYYDVVMGRKVNRDVEKGTAVDWDLI